MRYLRHWLYTDAILLFCFAPLFLVISPLMQLYFFIALFFIIKRVQYPTVLLFLGLIFLIFSNLNFVDILYGAKFEQLILFLVSLLLVAVVAQRVLEKENIYLRVSPYLFLAFSILFFQNLSMLFYFLFVFMMLLIFEIEKVVGDIKIAFKQAFILSLLALPLVVLFFLFFPRYGIKASPISFQSNYILSGFSDIVNVSSDAVFNSNKVVLEAEFNKKPKSLYFRGVVLYKYYKKQWLRVDTFADRLIKGEDKISYKIKLYPSNKKYIFALDIPLKESSNNIIMTKYFELRSQKKLSKVLNIQLSSYQKYILGVVKIPSVAFEYDKSLNLKTQKELEKIKALKSDEEKLQSLIEYFKDKKILYTTTPPEFKSKSFVDEFYKKKRGYCVHFASAFALSARMVGLASRVISGFAGDKENLYKNYIVIKEKDAHAWVEVFIKKRGWVRVDPTLFAAERSLVEATMKEEKKIDRGSLYLMYFRFKIEQWILYYDSYQQSKLQKLLRKKEFLLKFILFFVLLLIFITFLLYLLKRKKSSKEDKIIAKLLKGKKDSTTIYEHLESYNHPIVDEINTLYHKIKFYKYSKSDMKRLKELVKDFKR